MLYRGFATQEELDAQYDLLSVFPEAAARYAEFIARESDLVRAELDHRLGVPFGPTLDEVSDLYPAGGDAPILVYLHGGFWYMRRSEEFGFVARGPASRGVATAVVNYSLAPKVTILEILRQSRAAVAWIFDNAASFGGDPDRIHLAGHSAGGHLAAMILSTDWEGEYGLPPDVVKSATAISGLYDLAPFPFTFVQPRLQLTWREVSTCSPILNLPEAAPPLLLAYGGLETPEFKRQSEDYLAAWKSSGLDGDLLVLPNRNHFDVIDGFLDAESPLCSRILGLMGVV